MGSVSMRSEASLQASSRGERVSALIDGEWNSEESEAFIGALDREDRAAWSDYHLIGDTLRSDDLALSAGASRAFMIGFAARFESEAHIVAPSSSLALRGRRSAFGRRLLPAFAVAAAAATLTWIVVPQLQGVNTGVQVASVSSGDTLQRVAMAPVATAQPAVQDANIIRDAGLDQYLEAHQQFAQQPVMGSATPLIRAAVTTQGR